MTTLLRRNRFAMLAFASLIVFVSVILLGAMLVSNRQKPPHLSGTSNPEVNNDSKEATPAVAKAAAILEQVDPAFKSGEFRATTSLSSDGNFCSVKFVRTAGIGKDRYLVNVRVTEDPIEASRARVNLKPGTPAPAIEGIDVNGKPMVLTESRGKVVLLVFCTPTCGPCRAFYPLGKELVKQFVGRPFALVEVVGCCTQDEGRKMVERERLPWPVLWDGESGEGPIQKQWGVEGYPTYCLIDHNGIIVGNFSNPRFIGEKVAEAEASRKK